MKNNDWRINRAPGSGTGSMAAPATVACTVCGRGIGPDEDCWESDVLTNEGHNEYDVKYMCNWCHGRDDE